MDALNIWRKKFFKLVFPFLPPDHEFLDVEALFHLFIYSLFCVLPANPSASYMPESNLTHVG